MAPKNKLPVTELLKNLEFSSKNEEHLEVLDNSSKILRVTPDHEEALRKKVIALINLDKYDEAFKTINEFPKNVDLFLSLEKAYVLYKLHKHDDLKELISKIPSHRGLDHILAQDYYQSGKADEAYSIYKSLIESTIRNNESLDLPVNERAAISLLKTDKLPNPISPENSASYDQLFNEALISIEKGNLDKSLDILSDAKVACQQADISNIDVKNELAAIIIQASYVNHLKGDNEVALSLLNELDPDGFSDPALKLILNNNIVSLSSSTFDPIVASRKIVSNGNFNTVKERLLQEQEKILRTNLLVLDGFANKDIRKQALKLFNQFPSVISPGALGSLNKVGSLNDDDLLWVKTKQISKYFKKNSTIFPGFALAQLQISSLNFDGAAKTLERVIEISDKNIVYQPGFVGLLVTIYEKLNRHQSIVKLFENVYKYLLENESLTNREILLKIIGFKFLSSNNEEQNKIAKEIFSKLDSSDILIKLAVAITNNQNIDAADFASVHPISLLTANVDVESLENEGVQLLVKKRKATDIGSHKTKKHKTKKGKLPKNYDPNRQPDPERWLPLRERSTWKPKKGKKHALNDTQGAVGEGITDSTGIIHSGSGAGSKQPVTQSKKSVKGKKKKKGKK